MNRRTGKIIILAIIAALVAAFFIFDFGNYLTLDYLKAQQNQFNDYYQSHRASTLFGYFIIYILVTALSLPGATIMTLAGGAMFGFWVALLMVSFASTIGATLAFLASRFLLRDWVEKKFGDKLQAINTGIEKEGAIYLFSLRLVPLFPFFVINLVMGLTKIKTRVYYLVSQIGMFAGTIVFVNAGTQIGQLESAAGIISPGLLFSFALLGIFPLIAKRILAIFQAKKVFSGHKKPQNFDYNLIVLGAGSGGLVSSYIAAAVKAKVALIEKHQMGGDCLNTGCVPSKALIRSAKMVAYAKRAKEFGLKNTINVADDIDFAAVMERVQEKITQIEPHDSIERYTKLGVDVISGEGKITSPWTVEVNGKTLTSRSIIVATGASPFIPPIKGLDKINYLTSDNLWELRQLPQRLVILGGGPIGSEMAQAFARLGSKVTQVERGTRIMSREDLEVSEFVEQKFIAEGITVLTGHQALEVENKDGENWLICEHQGEKIEVPFDQLLIAVGRKANVTGFGLENLDIKINPQGTISADPFLRTNFPNIYCVGDVAGPYQFTHTAAHQAWYAAVNALFGQFKSFKVDYRIIPWCTFTDAEVARVGLNESEATAQNIPFEITKYDIGDLDRAIADSVDNGWVKILTKPGSDKILGVTIVGYHAGDLLAEYVLAMKYNLGLNKVLGTIHTYPTLAEMNKMAAGEWKRAHAPEKLLGWIEKYHSWRRG